jgi:protein phosphatase 4 regulatory subunit 3
MLNDHAIYEHIVEDDLFTGVVGMLECQYSVPQAKIRLTLLQDDPEFPAYKANYREVLKETSHFHQPIPIQDIGIQRKIHHTFRLQFLKDVVLARALDDSTFTILNACIIYNQTDIITHITTDGIFIREIVRLYVDEEMLALRERPPSEVHDPKKPPSPPPKRVPSYAFSPPDDLPEAEIALRREVILLIQQICNMAKNVQLQARMALFRSLVDRGILFAVQWALERGEKTPSNLIMVNTGGEILTALLDHDINGVRSHVLKQDVAIGREREQKRKGANEAADLALACCRILAKTGNLGVQTMIGDALKCWLDTPIGSEAGAAASGSEAGHVSAISMPNFCTYTLLPGLNRCRQVSFP